jgi:hypothetical protein
METNVIAPQLYWHARAVCLLSRMQARDRAAEAEELSRYIIRQKEVDVHVISIEREAKVISKPYTHNR